MRRTPGPVGKGCETCHVWYFGRPNQKSCRSCAEKRKKASDAATHRAARGRPQLEVDLSEAQIEAAFAEALAQIRRERRFTVDITSSHAWKFQEPGR